MDTTTLTQHRKAKDAFFAQSDQSPLSPRHRDGFTGLRYFDPDPDFVVTVPIEAGDGSEVRVQTSDGRQRVYRRAGHVSFEVNGRTATLTLYATDHPGLFLPFRDATSGSETYGAGRYLDLEPNDDGTITIDFNYAYNPFCAYDDAYSCPLPPVENWLSITIRAGEQTFA